MGVEGHREGVRGVLRNVEIAGQCRERRRQSLYSASEPDCQGASQQQPRCRVSCETSHVQSISQAHTMQHYVTVKMGFAWSSELPFQES